MSGVIIIAEAGVNHNGSIDLAKELIDIADRAGADFVKFQAFKSELLVSASAEKAAYQKEATDVNESQLDMLKALELNQESHQLLLDYCKGKTIKFLSSAFDLESLDFLGHLNLELYKIPSGEISNLPYLQKVGGFGRRVVMSTGMSDMQEISAALDVLIESGTDRQDITILHCNTEYPTPMHDVNLRAMLTIGEELDVAIGYSDHTIGIEVPIAAVGMGATVIEKHITLDKNMDGPDHQSSIEPEAFIAMVQSIRNIEVALGSAVKEASTSELKNIVNVRKSIHLAKDLEVGHELKLDDFIMQRPGDGMSPMKVNTIVGRRLCVSLSQGDKLLEEHLEL